MLCFPRAVAFTVRKSYPMTRPPGLQASEGCLDWRVYSNRWHIVKPSRWNHVLVTKMVLACPCLRNPPKWLRTMMRSSLTPRSHARATFKWMGERRKRSLLQCVAKHKAQCSLADFICHAWPLHRPMSSSLVLGGCVLLQCLPRSNQKQWTISWLHVHAAMPLASEQAPRLAPQTL